MLSPFGLRPKTKRGETSAAFVHVYPSLAQIKECYKVSVANSDGEGGYAPEPDPFHEINTFPVVEVANPHFGILGDEHRTIHVCRPWSESECAEPGGPTD